jgi:hypothetical protein
MHLYEAYYRDIDQQPQIIFRDNGIIPVDRISFIVSFWGKGGLYFFKQ